MISNMNSRNNMDILTRSQNIVLRRTRRRLPIIANDEYSTVIGIEQQNEQKQPEITLSNDQNLSIVDQKHLKYSEERVTVQYLNNYTQLTNNHNCWNNFRHFYSQNVSKNNYNINNLEKKEIEEEKKDNKAQDLDDHLDTFNHNHTRKKLSSNYKQVLINNLNNCNNNNNNEFINKDNVKPKTQCPGECAYIRITSAQDNIATEIDNNDKNNVRRTQDQEYAFRCIESVHNYAKLSLSDNSGEDVSIDPVQSRISCSSSTDIQDEGDSSNNIDNLDDNNNGHHRKIDVDHLKSDAVEEQEDADVEADSDELRERIEDNSDLEYEHYFKKRYHYQQYRNHRDRHFRNHHDQSFLETDDDKVDNVQIEKNLSQNNESIEKNFKMANNKSSSHQHHNHHARRPMNAFLIFCKRHRSIVKERYKTLENRGITKILGEWWASLNAADKESFVKLAKQNKDAFFSANPNFKWYKLPTTHMRSNDTQVNECPKNDTSSESYFKLASEAEIGEQLRGLIQTHSDMKESLALQQILGETKQFLTEQMPTVTTESTSFHLEDTKPHLNQLKKRKYNTKLSVTNPVENHWSNNDIFLDDNDDDNNVSKNNDLETVPKKKYNRLCKGKIYQELINSGQLIGAGGTPTTTATTLGTRPYEFNSLEVDSNRRKTSNLLNVSNSSVLNNKTLCYDNNFSNPTEVSNDQKLVETFDLEEKIKELPALDLDNYLQSKRHNTKKKRKFSIRTNSNYTRKWKSSSAKIDDATKEMDKQYLDNEEIFKSSVRLEEQRSHEERQQQQQLDSEKQQSQSQKRKQQEVVAVVGSQKRKARKESITRRDVSSIENEFLSMNGCCYLEMENPTTELLMLTTPKTLSTITTPMPTSDLLILAEVASNRTELKP